MIIYFLVFTLLFYLKFLKHTDLVETAKHYLWSCDFEKEVWKRIITLLIPIYPRAMYTWGVILWAVVQGKPMAYEQEEAAVAVVIRHGLMQKKH